MGVERQGRKDLLLLLCHSGVKQIYSATACQQLGTAPEQREDRESAPAAQAAHARAPPRAARAHRAGFGAGSTLLAVPAPAASSWVAHDTARLQLLRWP